MKTKVIFLTGLLFSTLTASALESAVEAVSSINWITRDFTTELTMDTQKAGLEMPSGKKSASQQIKSKMPPLIQGPLLSLYNDSETKLSDMVIDERLSLDQIYHFIMGGYKTPDVFTPDMKKLTTKNTVNTNNLSSLLVRHSHSYNPEKPIETVPSRPYSGIIIDARGALPVHGEYVKSETFPCFFPKIWDEQMNSVYEKDIVSPEVAKKSAMVSYHYSDDTAQYENRVGGDPLYIKATQVFGRNRTDPVIKRKDALRIFTVPENVRLLQEGKVVILLDQKNLEYRISIPEKTPSYYVQYSSIKQYFYENKVPDVTVSDSIDGIKFFVDLKFYPDSEELLPSEKTRIEAIAENLKMLLANDGYTILIEGHTADVGKPAGQQHGRRPRPEPKG